MRESFKPANTAPGTVIGPNVRIEGDVLFTGRIELNCAVRGNVFANDASGELVIGGSVTGSVKSGALFVLATASIAGDVSYGNLTVEPGARIDGILANDSCKVTA